MYWWDPIIRPIVEPWCDNLFMAISGLLFAYLLGALTCYVVMTKEKGNVHMS